MAGDVFSSEKTRVLSKVDLSRKGSVDAAIAPLVHYLNSLDAFYTTSSCSGRISVFCEVISSFPISESMVLQFLFYRMTRYEKKNVNGCLCLMTPFHAVSL